MLHKPKASFQILERTMDRLESMSILLTDREPFCRISSACDAAIDCQPQDFGARGASEGAAS
jgi:hypothetical protein